VRISPDKRMNQPPVITGNYYNKHETDNPLYRALVQRYRATLQSLLRELAPAPLTALEIGSGEGYIVEYATAVLPGLKMAASDIEVGVARAGAAGYPLANWCACVGEHLPFPEASFDLVLACEVLEHVRKPEVVLQEMRRVGRRWLVASVPHEPWWRLLNFMRLKYVSSWGNTPGHLQHWGMRGFARQVSPWFKVRRVTSAFPWVFLVGEVS
jgi:SAM-dependent methyltransferase